MNLLMGSYEYGGTISAQIKFQYFPFAMSNRTLATETVVRDACHSYHDWELVKELTLLDVSEDVLLRPFNTLSSGEQTKILLCKSGYILVSHDRVFL